MFLRYDAFPVNAEGIALNDVGVCLQRQEVDVLMDDLLCLCQHLGFTYPKGSGGDGDGEVVDLDAIELTDVDLDGVHLLEAEE